MFYFAMKSLPQIHSATFLLGHGPLFYIPTRYY